MASVSPQPPDARLGRRAGVSRDAALSSASRPERERAGRRPRRSHPHERGSPRSGVDSAGRMRGSRHLHASRDLTRLSDCGFPAASSHSSSTTCWRQRRATSCFSSTSTPTPTPSSPRAPPMRFAQRSPALPGAVSRSFRSRRPRAPAPRRGAAGAARHLGRLRAAGPLALGGTVPRRGGVRGALRALASAVAARPRAERHHEYGERRGAAGPRGCGRHRRRDDRRSRRPARALAAAA